MDMDMDRTKKLRGYWMMGSKFRPERSHAKVREGTGNSKSKCKSRHGPAISFYHRGDRLRKLSQPGDKCWWLAV
ncbi:hypothetical protein H9L39_00542 [Fusarium oxysporum f. sp. albedinis]|nr:hypothetical protein H9L39_00542 [Fusarium oxysporum f. sp. albedinis]